MDEITHVEAWKTAMDLQKHFNDILMRIRNFYFLYLGALGAVVATIAKIADIKSVHVNWQLAVAATTPGLALYVLDRFYYQGLLIGAVKVASELEKGFPPSVRITTAITEVHHSRQLLGLIRKSDIKVTIFYALPLCVGSALVFHWVGFGVLILFVLAEVIAWLQGRNTQPPAPKL